MIEKGLGGVVNYPSSVQGNGAVSFIPSLVLAFCYDSLYRFLLMVMFNSWTLTPYYSALYTLQCLKIYLRWVCFSLKLKLKSFWNKVIIVK